MLLGAFVASLVVAVLVGVARLDVGVHVPLDLVGGWCLGLLCGLAVVTALDRWAPGTEHTDLGG